MLSPALDVCAEFAEGERKPVLVPPAGVFVGVAGTGVLMIGVLVDLGGTGVLRTGVLVGPGVGVGGVGDGRLGDCANRGSGHQLASKL